MKSELDISIIIPCLNEEPTIEKCVKKALRAIKKANIQGEVLVSDNMSTDNSAQIAKKAGARVVYERKKGYGNNLKNAFKEAKGKYIIMGDADNTYDFDETVNIYKKLKQGYDFVMGDRYKKGRILDGATPFSHKIGVPILTWILNKFYGINISDSQCGMRGITKEAYLKLNMQSSGMEFASEMLVKAAKMKLKIAEVPLTLSPREGTPAKLHTYRDGWRHLSFLLTQGTNFLFIYPGTIITIIGIIIFIMLIPGHITILGRTLHYHILYFASILIILGTNTLTFGIITKLITSENTYTEDHLLAWIKKLTLEKILLTGLSIFVLSLLILIYTFIMWKNNHFGTILNNGYLITGFTLLIISVNIAFAGFFFKIIQQNNL